MMNFIQDGMTIGLKWFWLAGAVVFSFGCSGLNDAELAKLSPEDAGRKVFEAKCIRCHTIDGNGGTRGPNLSNVGGRIDLETLRNFIADPQSVKPGASMRKISLSGQQIDWVAGYLFKLK